MRAQPQQRQRAQDTADAQEVVIADRQPDPTAVIEVLSAHNLDIIAADGELEPIELQHELEGLQERLAKEIVGSECRDVVLGQQRRRRIRAARFRKRKQPLDVIVMTFQRVERVLMNVAQQPSAMIAPVAAIERN